MLKSSWTQTLRPLHSLTRLRMSTNSPSTIHFGPFEVTNQVFLTTPHSFAVVNLKPLLPGHVLVCPLQRHLRLTDLSTPELTDLFQTVQRVQRMLARHYFAAPAQAAAPPEAGSFNIALQDGPGAGQTVAHVHVHVIPRIRGRTAKPEDDGPTDELYERMAAEDGNVGGTLWDRDHPEAAVADGTTRPVPGGQFPRIEDCDRKPRSTEEMMAEAAVFKEILAQIDADEEVAEDR